MQKCQPFGTTLGGGDGASIYSGATLINNDLIAAGASGGTDNSVAGVYDHGGSLMNRGIIIGGAAGAATSHSRSVGTGGAGVILSAGYA